MIRTVDGRPAFGHGHFGRDSERGARWSPRFAPGAWKRLIKELVLIAALAAAYEAIRENMVQAGGAAASHGQLIVSAERALGIFHEQAVQAALIGSDTVTDAFNAYYGGTHFLIPALVLAWLLFRHPAHYGRARTALVVTTALGFVVFWLFPVAPPRLLPAHFGIVDTLVAPDGSGNFDNAMLSSAGDVYASMPSIHVAWAVWTALALFPVVRHWALRVLVVAYPLLTTLVVVATGNHFFLDAIAGAVLACGSWVLATRARARLTVELATWRARHGWRPSQPAIAELPAGSGQGGRGDGSPPSPAAGLLGHTMAEERQAAPRFRHRAMPGRRRAKMAG